MKDSYDCDCGICGVCNGTRKPLPPQKEGTHKWQHEETGRLVDIPHGENPGHGYFVLSDK